MSEMNAGINTDKIGAVPSSYDTDALPVRRYAALTRGLMIAVIAEGFALAGMSFAFAAIVPLQKVVPMVVSSNKMADEIIHLNPVTVGSPAGDYLTEVELRKYVEDRYSVNASPAQQSISVNAVQMMTDQAALQDYVRKAQSEYNRLRTLNMVRNVSISSVRRLPNTDSWQVEYTTTDQADQPPVTGSQPVEQHSWVSTYQVTFHPQAVRYENRLVNPLGMLITASSDARRD